MAHPILIAILAGFVVVGALSFIPLPNTFNVDVKVTSSEVPLVVATLFSINSVSGSTLGSATIVDWGGVGLGFAWGSLQSTFSMTVCVGNGHCSTKTASQWFPSLPNGQSSVSATNDFIIGYVPGGQAPISVTLTDNGQTVATGSGSMCVGC